MTLSKISHAIHGIGYRIRYSCPNAAEMLQAYIKELLWTLNQPGTQGGLDFAFPFGGRANRHASIISLRLSSRKQKLLSSQLLNRIPQLSRLLKLELLSRLAHIAFEFCNI
jgi:hypothetical protein